MTIVYCLAGIGVIALVLFLVVGVVFGYWTWQEKKWEELERKTNKETQ